MSDSSGVPIAVSEKLPCLLMLASEAFTNLLAVQLFSSFGCSSLCFEGVSLHGKNLLHYKWNREESTSSLQKVSGNIFDVFHTSKKLASKKSRQNISDMANSATSK